MSSNDSRTASRWRDEGAEQTADGTLRIPSSVNKWFQLSVCNVRSARLQLELIDANSCMMLRQVAAPEPHKGAAGSST